MSKAEPIRVFVSYSHQDSAQLAKLQEAIRPLEREGLIAPWTDRLINVGEDWQGKIDKALQDCELGILLVSMPFLGSDFIHSGELQPLLERAGSGHVHLVPVLLRECDWKNSPIRCLQPAPGFDQYIENPGDDQPSRDRAWTRVVAAIRNLANAQNSPTVPSSREPPMDDGLRPSRPLQTLHHKMAARLLSEPRARKFLEALQHQLVERFQDISTLLSTHEAVAYFTNCPADRVQRLFFAVRGALRDLTQSGHDSDATKDIEEAAAALYCLAACQLVNQATHRSGSYVLQVPSSERVICAIIATALFGGELRLKPDEQPSFPRPEFVFEVRVPADGDWILESFERAVYVALISKSGRATEASLDSGPLDERQRAWLETQFDDIKHVEKGSLALVLHGVADSAMYSEFSSRYQIPVMLPNNQLTTALLGMSTDRLLTEIQKFWEGLAVLPNSGSQVQTPRSSGPSSEVSAMSKSDIHFHGPITNVALSSGGHSVAQAGPNSAAHLIDQKNSGAWELTPLFQDLMEAIKEVPVVKTRASLSDHVEAAQTEAAKAQDADPGLIKRSLENVKLVGESLEGGEKIVDVCTRALALLAPFIQSMA